MPLTPRRAGPAPPRDRRRSSAAGAGWSPGCRCSAPGCSASRCRRKPDSPQFYGADPGCRRRPGRSAAWCPGRCTWAGSRPRPAPAPAGRHPGRDRRRRRSGSSTAAALVARRIPVARRRARHRCCASPSRATRPLVLLDDAAPTALGEEVFFRGALYAALGSERPVRSLHRRLHAGHGGHPQPRAGAGRRGDGRRCSACQRRATGGLQAPMLTHLTWSTLMVRYLPPLFLGPAATTVR